MSFRKCHILQHENSSPKRDSNPRSSIGGRLGKQTCKPLHHASPQRPRGWSSPRYHITLDSEPNTLPTELIWPQPLYKSLSDFWSWQCKSNYMTDYITGFDFATCQSRKDCHCTSYFLTSGNGNVNQTT